MKHLVIPDCQVKDGYDYTYLEKIGQYIVEKQPDKIICIGDFADMPSLSSYDVGKKSFEGRRYTRDVAATRTAMALLLQPLKEFNARQRKNGKRQYIPEMHLTLGNHEERINKAVDNDPKLDGVLSIKDLGYEEFGWKVYPFLSVVVLDGIAYSHYFVSGVMGRPVTSARALLTKHHMSCVAGHQQGRDIAYGKKANGEEITAIIAGSCYLHDEDYLNSQTNSHWRGFYVLHDVNNGSFDEMAVSLKYINEKYANMS